MSVQAITLALSVPAGSPSAKCVLLALANYANERGQCWPSQKRLAANRSIDQFGAAPAQRAGKRRADWAI